MATTERRYIAQPLEVRAKNEAGLPTKIGGIAAVVEQTTDMGWFEERIERGAFDSVLANSDIRCLFNHESELILGRTKSGTLNVFVNGDGNLEYECEVDSTSPTHVTVARAIERRDVDQSSYQYIVKTAEWSHSEKYGDMGLRTIKEYAGIYDVSPVTFPAYENTEADCRSIVEKRDSAEKERTEQILREMEYETESLKFYYKSIIQ